MDISASNWNEDDASNTTAAPDGAPEGMAPSGVNNVLRAIMGAVKRWFKWSTPATTAGSSTAYTLSYTVSPGALVDGMTHLVQFHTACGASPTLNVNALGATPLYFFSAGTWGAVPSGAIKADTIAKVAYHQSSGTYRIVSSSAPIVPFVVSGSDRIVAVGTTRFQAGQVVVGSGTATITFPVAFGVVPYVYITANGNSGALSAMPTVSNISTTQFDLTNTGANNINYLWFAFGGM